MVSQDAGESKDWRVVEKNGAEGGRNDQYDTHEGLDGVYREGIETTSEPDVSRLLSLIECRGLFLSSAECRAPLPVHGDERRTMPSCRRRGRGFPVGVGIKAVSGWGTVQSE